MMSDAKPMMIPSPGQPARAPRGSNAVIRDGSNRSNKSEDSLLSRSLGFPGSDMLAVLHRRSSESTCISHRGYLLKRSNKPFCDVQASSERSETPLDSAHLLLSQHDIDDIPVSDGTDQADEGDQVLRQPQHCVSRDGPLDRPTATSSGMSNMEETISLAAAFFGCDSDIAGHDSPSPTLKGDADTENAAAAASVHNRPKLKPNVEGIEAGIGISAESKRVAIPIYHRMHSAPPGMHPSDAPADDADDSAHSGHLPPPADYIDPRDGHIWRAKYCVLEDGVLYFYRNARDGDSNEAQVEREQMSLFHHHGGGCQGPSHLKSNGTADDLSKSPMAGQIHPLLHARDSGTAGSFCYDANVFCEKRVALDCVGEVRSAELEYGEKSFELLAIDYEDNPKAIDDDFVEDADSSSECKVADRLILRAGSSEEMNEWLFQFHRSLASFMKEIVDMVGSSISGVGDLHLPAEPYHAHGILAPPRMRANGAVPIPVIPPAPSGGTIGALGSHSPGAQNGAGSHASAVSAVLSHGHGRSGLHRRRIRLKSSDQPSHRSPMSTPGGGASPILSPDWEPSSLPRKNSRIAVPLAKEEFCGFGFSKDEAATEISKSGEIVSSPPRPFRRIGGEETKAVSEQMPFVASAAPPAYPLEKQIQLPVEAPAPTPAPVKTSKYIPPHLRNKADKQSGGQSISAGKYIPPHLRGGKDQSAQSSTRTDGPALRSLHGVEATSEDISQGMFELSVDDASKSLRPKSSNEMQYMKHSDGFGIDVTEEDDGMESAQMAENRRKQGRAETSHFMRGGCADPTVAIGSIVDPMYIPRKSSKVGKVHSKGYGGFGGGKPSFIQNSQQDSGTNDESTRVLHWEVGAVSECGIRESNEDSYVVSHDLVAAFDTSASFHGTQDDSIEGSDVVLPENDNAGQTNPVATQHHGLFAIFDGHCGNETARYAAEMLPSLIYDEYKKGSADTSTSAHERAETILSDAIKRLDEGFCNLCTTDGREWESGATAVVTLIIGDVITIANVGDSRGVMCMSSSLKKSANGWSLLEEDESKNGAEDSGGSIVYWKEVTDVHSPGREDEKTRIKKANGWITTETEIPISQLQRMDFLDKDVVEILRRCFSDRFDNDDPSSDPHKAGKKCSAEPGRLLHISRVCGELAVSRAIGDRDFKAAYNKMPLESEESNVSVASGVSAHNGDAESSVVGWECPLFLPYPDNHSKRFDGDLVSGTPEIQVLRAGESGVFDEFLLLACDGLWDVMDADDAVRVARGLLFEKGWSAQKAAARLAELAMHLGSSDNITVIVLRFFTEERKTSSTKVLVQ